MNLKKKGKNSTHCVKSVQIRSFFWSVFSRIRTDTGKYGPKKTPYLDTFYPVTTFQFSPNFTFFYLSAKVKPEDFAENLLRFCSLKLSIAFYSVFNNVTFLSCNYSALKANEVDIRTIFSVSSKLINEKCPNTEFFWSVFSRIWTEFGDFVGNKAKGRISKRVSRENKVRQIFQKTNISYLMIRTRTCEYQGVRNVHFSQNLTRFIFL